jgi:hypothetical protein
MIQPTVVLERSRSHLEASRKKLFDYREDRIHPHKVK